MVKKHSWNNWNLKRLHGVLQSIRRINSQATRVQGLTTTETTRKLWGNQSAEGWLTLNANRRTLHVQRAPTVRLNFHLAVIYSDNPPDVSAVDLYAADVTSTSPLCPIFSSYKKLNTDLPLQQGVEERNNHDDHTPNNKMKMKTAISRTLRQYVGAKRNV